MNYSVTIRRELTVLKIEEGTFDLRHGEAFNSTVADLLAREESKNLIIDFSDVKAIDTTVISALRFAQEFANKSGGVVIFVALCKSIKELLKLQELEKQLYLYSSVHEILTLIAPDVKGKRQVRRKKIAHADDIIDELLKCEVIAMPDIPAELDDELGVELDEELDENINAPLPESDDPAPFDSQAVKESGSKKKTAKAKETARKTTH